MTTRRKRPANRPDPRVIGGRYFCGYWRKEYTVLAIDLLGTRWTVAWEDDRQTTHMTAWDWRRDRIVAVPEPDAAAA